MQKIFELGQKEKDMVSGGEFYCDGIMVGCGYADGAWPLKKGPCSSKYDGVYNCTLRDTDYRNDYSSYIRWAFIKKAKNTIGYISCFTVGVATGVMLFII